MFERGKPLDWPPLVLIPLKKMSVTHRYGVSSNWQPDKRPHMGPEGVQTRKKTPIFFVDAKLSQIARGFQKCKF